MNYQFADRINNLKPSAIREILKNSDPNVISLAAGNPAVESFPVAEMRRLPTAFLMKKLGSLSSMVSPRAIPNCGNCSGNAFRKNSTWEPKTTNCW